MNDWRNCDAVERHPDRVSGAWVFRETRVPVSALFENLKDGASIEQFLEWFPGVKRSQVEAVLDYEAIGLAGYCVSHRHPLPTPARRDRSALADSLVV